MLTQDTLKLILSYDPVTGHFEWLFCSRKISNKGDYLRIAIGGTRYKAHHLAYLYMSGELPKSEIDHINGIKSDNRWKNLRLATRSQNNCNQGMRKRNKSGFKGVSWHETNSKWVSQIQHNKKKITIGYFVDKSRAALEYDKAALKLHGDFAKTNFPSRKDLDLL